jgi:hypothetical protein
MVLLLKFSIPNQTANVQLTNNDVFDIVNGLNIMVANAENDIAQFGGDPIDIAQCERYKTCLAEMQAVKEALTG